MFKKNFYLAFVLMLISIFLLTTIPTYASAEESYDTNYTPKRTTKKRTTKKHRKRSSKKRRSSSNSSQSSYPKWISWRWKSKIINDDGQKKFKIDITYTNKSKNKIIKGFFNRSITFSFKQYQEQYAVGEIKHKGKPYNLVSNYRVSGIQYTKHIKCEVYPGESYKLTYYIPFNRFKWKKRYNSKDHILLNFKLSHSFQVRKENMDAE